MNIKNNSKIKNYLIIKHGALGDIIQGLDAYKSLRESFPSANLTLLTSSAFTSLASLMPYFDSVIIDDRPSIFNIQKTFEIRQHFRKNWTAVIDLQCSKRTGAYFNWFYRKTGGKWYGTVKGCSHPMPNFRDVNNRDRMLEAVKMAGAKEFKANLSWLTADKKYSSGLNKPYCVIIPGSSLKKPSKRWSAKNYAKLSVEIYGLGVNPYVVGTKTEISVAKEICSLSKVTKSLVGTTNLVELAQICANAQFTVGNDTGPTFLAASMGVPTLMLMGVDTNPNMSAPTGNAAGFIYKDNIQAITPEEVIYKMSQLGGL